MSRSSDYIPGTDLGLADFGSNFVGYISAHQVELNLSVGDVAGGVDALAEYETKLAAHNAARDTARAAAEDKDNARDALETVLRILAQKMQNDPVMTDYHREQLRMTVPDTTPTPQPEELIQTTPAPLILVDTSHRGEAVIHFGSSPSNESANAVPQGVAGAKLYYHVGGVPDLESDWRFLADDTNSPYVHNVAEAKPVTLAYRALWFDRRMRVGPFGDPTEVAISA